MIFDIKEENSSKFVYFQATQCRTPFDLTNFFLKNFKQFEAEKSGKIVEEEFKME